MRKLVFTICIISSLALFSCYSSKNTKSLPQQDFDLDVYDEKEDNAEQLHNKLRVLDFTTSYIEGNQMAAVIIDNSSRYDIEKLRLKITAISDRGRELGSDTVMLKGIHPGENYQYFLVSLPEDANYNARFSFNSDSAVLHEAKGDYPLDINNVTIEGDTVKGNITNINDININNVMILAAEYDENGNLVMQDLPEGTICNCEKKSATPFEICFFDGIPSDYKLFYSFSF